MSFFLLRIAISKDLVSTADKRCILSSLNMLQPDTRNDCGGRLMFLHLHKNFLPSSSFELVTFPLGPGIW